MMIKLLSLNVGATYDDMDVAIGIYQKGKAKLH